MRLPVSIQSGVCLLLIILAVYNLPAKTPLDNWSDFASTPEAGKLMLWLEKSMHTILEGKKKPIPLSVSVPPYYGKLGIFITLVNKNKTRGCYGAFYHKNEHIAQVLWEYLRGALRFDDRHKPVDLSELNDIEVILTISGEHYPLSDFIRLDTNRYGIAIQFSDGNKIVLVPSEIKSIDYLHKILKGKNITQLYSFRAVTIRKK